MRDFNGGHVIADAANADAVRAFIATDLGGTARIKGNPSRAPNAGCNFARTHKTLKGLTPYELICTAWTSQP